MAAVSGLGLALQRMSRELGERSTVLMGTMAAFVFAAQMVNFPVGPGVSGHLMGGVLAAVMVGPWAGAVVIACVLIVQCLLFGDGGLMALGANFVNMGLIGSVLGYQIYSPLRRAIGGPKGVVVGAMGAAWFSLILAAGACALELAASRRMEHLIPVLGWMLLVHAVIGLGEAVITGLVVRFVLQVRPDFLYESASGPSHTVWRAAQAGLAGLAIAAAVALFLSPFASSSPDGLEYVGERLGIGASEGPPLVAAPIREYEMPGLSEWAGIATAAAGLSGTLVVFGVGFALARVFGRSAVALAAADVGALKKEPVPDAS